MSKKQPLVSVVMGVYNGGKYLRESIDSILNQTYTDFEFIIIDDGSTDNSKDIIGSYGDPRIITVSRENRGLVSTLNEAIDLAKGEYIARQDDDDISSLDRLQKEVDYLNREKNIVLVGSSIGVIDENGDKTAEHRVLLNDLEIRAELSIRSPFAHGSVMFRRDAAVKAGVYRDAFWPAEDFDLWVRLSNQGKMANIDELLYLYRLNDQGISAQNTASQENQKQKIMLLAQQTTSPSFPTRQEIQRMLKLYCSSLNFFFRKRVERLLLNYLRLPQYRMSSKSICYVFTIVSIPIFWKYFGKSAFNRLTSKF